jgi:hypothetical protein
MSKWYQDLLMGLLLTLASATVANAQSNEACRRDRTISTVVGAGLGGVVAAIPATIVHRHDQTSSHRIVAVSVSAGALIGFVAAGRDRPCLIPADTSRHDERVLSSRSRHAQRGALIGILTGTVVGASGGTFYDARNPAGAILFSAGEGAIAGGVLGSLIGWVMPAR